MPAWSEGYFTDVQYTGYFYAYMAPPYLSAACLLHGVRPPELTEGAAYLELGCGQGFGLNLMAAANPQIAFHGVDFHPGQIANAQRLARAAGLANVSFRDWSFAQMLAAGEGELPRVDVVALHGVYSWVSPENRAAIVAIIDRVLKPGGLVYASYNAMPGWSPHIPVRQFLAEHYARSTGEPAARLTAALQAAQAFAETGAGFLSQPGPKQIIARSLRQPPAYLFHEYLNADYHALFHAEVAEEMDAARLSFACSAVGAEDIAALSAPAKLRPMIEAAADETWRQTLLDYAGTKSFRRDIFVRGRNELSAAERSARLKAVRFAMLVPQAAVNLEFPVPIGTLTGDPAIYRPIVEGLADGPRTLGELMAAPALKGADEGLVLRAVTLLLGGGQIHPAPGGAAGPAAGFNRALVEEMEYGGGARHIAAGVTGTGVPVSFTDLLGLRAALRGEDAAETARLGLELMARGSTTVQKDGKPLTDPKEAEAEVLRRIKAFPETKLPLLHQIGAV